MRKPGNGIHKTPILPYLPFMQILTHLSIQEGSPTAIRTINTGSTPTERSAFLSKEKPINTLQ